MAGFLRVIANKAASRVRRWLTPARVRGRLNPFSAELQSGRRLFFVTGRSKSGNTWMARLLNSHPKLFCDSHETHAFHQDWRLTFFEDAPQALHDRARNFFEQRAAELRKQGLILSLLRRCDKRSAELLGDKSPRQDVEAILEAFPECRVVVMLRDFRDMCVSLAFHAARSSGTWRGIFVDENRRSLDNDFLRMHLSNYEGHGDCATHRRLAEQRPERVRIVRYEDLKARPAETLSGALRSLGVDDDERTVRKCLDENTFEALSAGRKAGQADPNSFFRKGVVGDWRNHFDEANVAVFKELAGRTLIEARYETDENWTLRSAAEAGAAGATRTESDG